MRTRITNGLPKCPNHGCSLEIPVQEQTHSKGNSPCPVSGEMFAWEMKPESDKLILDKNGQMTRSKGYAVEDKQD